MSASIIWDSEAWEDYLWQQSNDKASLKRINALIKSILREGATGGIGKPEPLKGRSPWWSRRINEKYHLVYKVEDNAIYIAQCKGHYDDK